MSTENLTPKQQAVITKLEARKSRYDMKIDDYNRFLAKPVISFEDNQNAREMLKTYKSLSEKAEEEINEVKSQYDIYVQHLKDAKWHLDEAQKCNNMWGFKQ